MGLSESEERINPWAQALCNSRCLLLLDGWVCGSKEFSNNRPQLPVRNGHDETQDLQR